MSSGLGRAESLAAGAASALLVVGLAVLLLLAPAFTRVLVQRLEVAGEAGLSAESALRSAELVRGYVAGSNREPLPAVVGSREGFGVRAVAHLDDVRAVIRGARLATGVLAALLAAWIGVRLGRRESGPLVAGLKTGAVMLVSAAGVSLLAALLDFGRFFSAFHGLFFEEGTWQFPADDLLIQLFPEPFWIISGVAWAVSVLLGGALMYAAARLLERRWAPRPSDSA